MSEYTLEKEDSFEDSTDSSGIEMRALNQIDESENAHCDSASSSRNSNEFETKVNRTSSYDYTSCVWLLVAVITVLAVAVFISAGAIFAIDQRMLNEAKREVKELTTHLDTIRAESKRHTSSSREHIAEQITMINSTLEELKNMRAELLNKSESLSSSIQSSCELKLNETDHVSIEEIENNITELCASINTTLLRLTEINDTLLNISLAAAQKFNDKIECRRSNSSNTIMDKRPFFKATSIENQLEDDNVFSSYCAYNTSSSTSGIIVTAVLLEMSGKLACQCSLSNPSYEMDTYNRIPRMENFECQLVTIYCP